VSKKWPVFKLGELADVITKGTTPTSVGHDFVDNGINFVKVESITSSGKFIKEKFAHITAACHAALGRSQLQAGDILFSIAGALGRTGFVTSEILPANTNQALAIIRLKRGIDISAEYILKVLEAGSVLEQIEKLKGGVAQQNLSLSQVRDLYISVPPLPEQQRIVALLDEAFAGLATAKANAERNLQSARAVFECHLESVLTEGGDDWEEKTLGNVCAIARGGPPRPISEFITEEPGGINWIKISDATASGKYISETEQKIRPEGASKSRMVHDGDFILSNSMSFDRPYTCALRGAFTTDGWC